MAFESLIDYKQNATFAYIIMIDAKSKRSSCNHIADCEKNNTNQV